MTTALTAEQRTRLESLVSRARRLLEEDLAAQASGRFGIDADGALADPESLRLDPSSLAAWRELVGVIEHLCAEGESRPSAVARLLREAVFTHLNRLVAIRIAETLGLLPASLAAGRRSQGFLDLCELAPLLRGDDTGGYWMYLQLCGDELAADVPALFDPRNPLLALAPSPRALDALVDVLADAANTELWAAPDCLGWVYQFFNRKEERDAMRESNPQNSRELAVRDQFFTPRYVVDFLVQNTLGRRLLESDPASPLGEELTLLVDPPRGPGSPLDLDDLAVLDPAVGSGHFLLGAYDLLERAWEVAGVPAADAAPRIVRSLSGVDIDVRAAQVAAAAVMLRARRHCPDGALPRPNIVTARALPAKGEQVSLDVEVTPAQVRTLDALTAAMARASELGPALRIEAELETQVRHGDFGRSVERNGQRVLGLTNEAFAEEEAGLLAALQRLADQTTSSAAERLFAAEASDALRFVEAMRRRYDIVLMNPPYGEPVVGTKPYLRAAYPWAPSGVDLLAVFVGRGLELCKPDGYLGAITSRGGLFNVTFKEWRQQVLLSHRFTTLVDLGYRVMAEAKVEAAAYVVGREPSTPDQSAVFMRLLKGRDKATALTDAVAHCRAGLQDDRVYRLLLADLTQVPGSPIAYSMNPAIRRLFSDLPAISRQAEVRAGLTTGDDRRFVRAFWEVDPRRIARSRSETEKGGRWVPFGKGGDYSQYWSDINLVVDWERDGERIRTYGGEGARPQNTQYYFRPGLTWTLRTVSALSVRVLSAGCVFSHKGPGIFSSHALPLLAWLNSRYVRLLIDATSAGGDEDKTDVARSYEVGAIRALPDPTAVGPSMHNDLARFAVAAARAGAEADELIETTRRFVAPALLHYAGTSLHDSGRRAFRHELERSVRIIEAHDEADRILGRVLDPTGAADDALRAADGPLVTDLPAGRADPALLASTLADVVAEASARRGTARWIGVQHHTADRRLELAAVAEGRAPRALLDAAPPDLLPPEEPRHTVDDLVSYLMGVAFGRWDARIGRDPARAPTRPDLFDPVPVCSPGMLVGDDGFPASQAPSNYPLELPSPRLLIDQAGDSWDVEAAIARAAAVLFADPTAVLQDMVGILGRDLRQHLRRQFFREHVTRYTKSQRKAPIYWPLYVPSGAWGVWVYAPAFSRETLFAVVRTAAGRLDAAEAEIRRLRRERDAGGAGRSAREVVTLLEAEENLAEELRRFRDEAERIAGLGWEPDLDDGIVLCAAPLATLLPAWRDAATARDELRAGGYPWATVSRWAGQL